MGSGLPHLSLCRTRTFTFGLVSTVTKMPCPSMARFVSLGRKITIPPASATATNPTKTFLSSSARVIAGAAARRRRGIRGPRDGILVVLHLRLPGRWASSSTRLEVRRRGAGARARRDGLAEPGSTWPVRRRGGGGASRPDRPDSPPAAAAACARDRQPAPR